MMDDSSIGLLLPYGHAYAVTEAAPEPLHNDPYTRQYELLCILAWSLTLNPIEDHTSTLRQTKH